MPTINPLKNYLLAGIFFLTGVSFLLIGGWNVTSCIAINAPIAAAVTALVFMALFALISIIYSIFLFRAAKADAAGEQNPGLVTRAYLTTVLSLLIYALAPLVFIYFSAGSRAFDQQRLAAFQEMRPALLRYIAEHDKAPRQLNWLVPEYLPEIPKTIIFAEDAASNRRVQYVPLQNTARFCYKTDGWWVNYGTCYDIVKDRQE